MENKLLKKAIVEYMRDEKLYGLLINCNTEDELKQVKELLSNKDKIELMNVFTRNLIPLTVSLLELDEDLRDAKIKLLSELVPNSTKTIETSLALYQNSLNK